MSHVTTATHQNGSRLNTFKPKLVKGYSTTEQAEATYMSALELVQHIDQTLTSGTQHYRTNSGRLLRTLDEVVNAILANNLLWESESMAQEQEFSRAA